MKIGLITFHDTTNFGSLLQTYGLYKKINDLGYDCDVIDYQCENIIKREIPAPLKLTLNPKAFLKDLIFGGIIRKKYKELHRFLTSEIKLGKRCDKRSIQELRFQYDKFVIGSDITWGMDIIDKDLTFFLNFETCSKKKTAFSASVGNPWTKDEKLLIDPLIKEFCYIAVREDESADWVEELTGERPRVVCDPTMLITADDWKRYCYKRKDADRYVLVYFDNKNGDCLKTAKEYAAKHDLKVKLVGYGMSRKDVDIVRPLSLEDFLSLINDAAFVVTASYHGMLFSIYFNRQFAYYNRAHKSRMNTLARKLRVTDREGAEYDVLKMQPIDYDNVNAAVEEYRNYSINCLKELLEK